jgi:hypothetical protein
MVYCKENSAVGKIENRGLPVVPVENDSNFLRRKEGTAIYAAASASVRNRLFDCVYGISALLISAGDKKAVESKCIISQIDYFDEFMTFVSRAGIGIPRGIAVNFRYDYKTGR